MHTDAFSTEPWHLLRLISHETHVRDSRGGGRGEGGEEKGRKRGAVARDRAENKTGGGESDVGPGARHSFFERTHRTQKKKRKKKTIINQRAN